MRLLFIFLLEGEKSRKRNVLFSKPQEVTKQAKERRDSIIFNFFHVFKIVIFLA